VENKIAVNSGQGRATREWYGTVLGFQQGCSYTMFLFFYFLRISYKMFYFRIVFLFLFLQADMVMEFVFSLKVQKCSFQYHWFRQARSDIQILYSAIVNTKFSIIYSLQFNCMSGNSI
jgi:hypothetical protein